MASKRHYIVLDQNAVWFWKIFLQTRIQDMGASVRLVSYTDRALSCHSCGVRDIVPDFHVILTPSLLCSQWSGPCYRCQKFWLGGDRRTSAKATKRDGAKGVEVKISTCIESTKYTRAMAPRCCITMIGSASGLRTSSIQCIFSSIIGGSWRMVFSSGSVQQQSINYYSYCLDYRHHNQKHFVQVYVARLIINMFLPTKL